MGTRTSGSFSFGTPFARIDGSSSKFEGVAAGHVKISSNDFILNKHIGDFDKRLDEHMRHHPMRVQHMSFNYLVYLMHLVELDDGTEMPLKEAVASCRHDLSHFDMSDYKYLIKPCDAVWQPLHKTVGK